jgi:hypothetical protein
MFYFFPFPLQAHATDREDGWAWNASPALPHTAASVNTVDAGYVAGLDLSRETL